ncbi:hypothetical protein ES708_15228 [subsurface metagenome]
MGWSHLYIYRRSMVEAHVPTKRGIYCLESPRQVFYVGQAENLRRRLLEHLGMDGGRSRSLNFWLKSGFTFFRFLRFRPDGDLIKAERKQIIKYRPACNIDIRTLIQRPDFYNRDQKVNK